VSLVVGAIAIGQHFGLATGAHSADTIAVASTSTLGNSGLLAAYLLMNIALAGYLAATSERYRLLYFLAGGANLLALIYAENRSTVIGLVLGAMVGGFISPWSARRREGNGSLSRWRISGRRPRRSHCRH